MFRACHRGFTLVEILIVIAIMGIFIVVSYAAFKNLRDTSALRIATQDVYTALVDARNSTLAAESNSVFGVHFTATSVTRFTGSVYSEGASGNQVAVFDTGVTATGTFITNGTDVVFEHLTGVPSATGSIILHKPDGSGSSTITVFGSGLIDEE